VFSASFLLKLNYVGHGISSLVAAYLPFEWLGQIIFTRILDTKGRKVGGAARNLDEIGGTAASSRCRIGKRTEAKQFAYPFIFLPFVLQSICSRSVSSFFGAI